MRPARTPLALTLLLFAMPAAAADEALLGFTPESARRQREVEEALVALPSAARCESLHARLTRAPHVAGTEGARRVAEEVAAHFQESGLETEIVRYDVLLSWPRKVEVEMVA